jgi:hypothetical protein
VALREYCIDFATLRENFIDLAALRENFIDLATLRENFIVGRIFKPKNYLCNTNNRT